MSNTPEQALKGRVVRCILFDLGDTLWSRGNHDTWKLLEASANQRAVALLREHVASQLPATLDDLALGVRLRESFTQYVRTLIHRNTEIEPDGPSAVLETLLQWGIKGIDIRFGAAIFESLRVRIPESRPLFEDTTQTLAALQERGFLLGVVTNRIWGGEPFQQDMQTLGLFDYFDPPTIAVSADLGVRKPNPAIFFHALNALNVEPQDAVMVGDSLGTDILGAQRLGIFAVWKPKLAVRERISAHLLTGRASTNVSPIRQTLSEPEIAPDEISMYETFTGKHHKHGEYLEKFLNGEIMPDLIVEHSRDLLDVFMEVGVQ